mgnify:CR=1 FL=1
MSQQQTQRIILEIISLLIFIFILTQILVSGGVLLNLDLLTGFFVPTIENNFLTQLSIITGFIFDTITLLIISAIISIFLWIKNNKKESLLFIASMLLTSGIVFVIKNLVQRARPLNPLIYESGFSFPSGHATTSLVFFGILTYLILIKNKSKLLKFIILCISIFMVALISFSRLYLNVHWMTDIVGGISLGFFILLASITIYEIIESKVYTMFC